jgi:TetR/AcrR family fatty acid metabolism transcriptional regulator
MSLQTPPKSRTRQPKAVRELAILAAAHQSFSTKGYEKTAMSEIAKEAGIAEGTIYKHFANKQELLARVFSDFYTALIEKTKNSLEGIVGIEEQLRVLITRHIQTFFEDKGMCRLLLQEVRPLNNYPHSHMHQLTREYSEILLKVITDGIDKQEIRADISAKTIRDMIFGSLEHAGWNVITANKPSMNYNKLTHEIISVTLNGLVDTKPKSHNFNDQLSRLEKIVTQLERH